MKRFLLAVFILSAGGIGSEALRQANRQLRATAAARHSRWQAATNRLADLTQATTTLRAEVARKKTQLAQTPPLPNLSPALRELLEGKADTGRAAGHAAAWAELRAQLETGWNSSADYVLVSKPALKRLSFQRLVYAERATDTACAVLALSPEEQDRIKTTLQHARETMMARVQRNETAGNIVAQYTIQTDPILEGTLSNQFSTELAGILGPERADLFLPAAWREFKPGLAPEGSEPAILTIRRSENSTEPTLVWELRQGKSAYTNNLRYGHYPSSWFLTLFPGGWEPIAQREGFELPKNFRN